MHEKVELIYVAIAIVTGALAAWLSVTAATKAAINALANAQAAERSVNKKLNEALHDIAILRRQIASLIHENAALSGNPIISKEDEDWEKKQNFLEIVAAQSDDTDDSDTINITRLQMTTVPKDGKLVFRPKPIGNPENLGRYDNQSKDKEPTT